MASERIHSGHFMKSNPDEVIDPTVDEEDEDVEVEVVDDDEGEQRQDSREVDGLKGPDYEKPVTFYKFGPKKTQSIAIDVSLNKLNKCIKVAYNKMTTPKWKDFKGLRLHWKQRVRLNNVIWRAFFLEFGKFSRKKKAPYCYFSVPEDDTTHSKIEGSILEGMYWKRRMEAVCAQYKRWRCYNRSGKRNAQKRKLDSSSCNCDVDGNMIYVPPPTFTRSQTPRNTSSELFDIDEFENVFTDTLFDSLSQPYMFPNPKEMAQSGNPDIMQPGLLPLQPSLEDIMSSLDSPFAMEHNDEQKEERRNGRGKGRGMTEQNNYSKFDLMPDQGNKRATYSEKEYDAAHLLVSYSKQQVSNEQQMSHMDSSMTLCSMGLLASTVAPLYSQAFVYDRPYVSSSYMSDASQIVSTSASQSPLINDYTPQFATLAPAVLHRPRIVQTTWQQPHHLQRSSALGQQISDSLSTLTSNKAPPQRVSKASLKAYPWQTTNTQQETNEFSRRSSKKKGKVKGDLAAEMISPVSGPKQTSLRKHSTVIQQLTSARPLLPLDDSSPVLVQSDPSQLHQQQITWQLLNPVDQSSAAVPSSPKRPLLASQASGRPHKSPFVPVVQPFCCELSPEKSCVDLSSVKRDMRAPTASSSFVQEQAQAKKSATGASAAGTKRAAADSTIHSNERKRILHLHAEQSRRSALKEGFDQLTDVLPNLYSGGTKPTNAVVLAKAGEHIRQLSSTNSISNTHLSSLTQHIGKLNAKIAALQSTLPCSSKSLSINSQQPLSAEVCDSALLQQYFDRYTKDRSKQDWPFWILSRMMQPLFDTFKAEMRSMTVKEECEEKEEQLLQTGARWAGMHCQAANLRPIASQFLVQLATDTDFLADAHALRDHVQQHQ